MKIGEEVFYANYEDEMACFIMLCNERDINFLDIPKRKRKTEDYVRLMCIALTFQWKGVFLKLVSESDNRTDEICKCLEQSLKNPPLIRKWIDDFVGRIQDAQIRKLAEDFVAEKYAEIESRNLSITSLFH